MSETIKQAVDRCRGSVFVLLHPDYTDGIGPLRLKVSKPEAKKLVIDRIPRGFEPKAAWEGEDLILMPDCRVEGDPH